MSTSRRIRKVKDINLDSLSKEQMNVLSQIAIDRDLGHNTKTIKSLLKLNLIEEYEEKQSWAPIGVYFIKRYRVPIAVHMAWCEWCAKQPLDDED